MTLERLVVVGASLAGVRAVQAARRAGFAGQITLVGAETHLPCDRPQLTKSFLRPDAPDNITAFHSATELRDDLGVELRLGVPADGLDTRTREVFVDGGAVPYDALVIATGAAPRPFAGADRIAGVHSVRTEEDALAIRAALDARARTVVVGAGFVGSEIASAARERGLPVTVVESSEVPLSQAIGREAGTACAWLHRAAGTDLRLSTGVAAIESEGTRVTAVRLDDGTTLPADLVVLGIGVAPATGWLEGSGVPLHERDRGVLCDATLATGVPGVYAAGDVAHVVNPLFDGDLMRLAHWTTAAEQGAAAARHALDPLAAQPVAAVPYFWSDWYGHRIQFAGTPRADEVVCAGDAGAGLIALYRRGDRIVGALTVDRRGDIMKFRRRIADRGPWQEAVALATAARVAVPA